MSPLKNFSSYLMDAVKELRAPSASKYNSGMFKWLDCLVGDVEAVACSKGVTVYCPKTGRLSFFNSPYPSHRNCSAVDIYPGVGFGCEAPSPVEGEVVAVRAVRCPEGKDFEASTLDYVVLLRSLENPDVWVKVLHVKPCVPVGEVVRAGAPLGFLLRSGFFDFWTDPHVHVEVRSPSDPIRARGGFTLERLIELDTVNGLTEELRGVVVESKPEYSLISLNNGLSCGLPVDVDGEVGFLDGGIPHYGYFGVHLSAKPSEGSVVRLCGVKIGVVKFVFTGMCLAVCCGLNFKLDGKPVRLSTYIHPSGNYLLKVVPNRLGELKLDRSQEVSLTIS